MDIGAGRFAPSPTSSLHLGNLRTALLAWLFARSTGRSIRLRIEDLDTARVRAAGRVALQQQADLAAIGLDFDGPVVWQSERGDLYREAISKLDTYPCFCTRREIAEASSAPNGRGAAVQVEESGLTVTGERPYPGTCRTLNSAQRAELAAIRPAAVRVRAAGARFTVDDVIFGQVSGEVDDFVLLRNDGTPAYNLAVVVDDVAMGVDQIVRGDDLLASAPRQAWLTEELGGHQATYAHIPLALNARGQRLAKRDGPVSLSELTASGHTPGQVLSRIAASLGLADANEAVTPGDLIERFDPIRLPRHPWVVEPQAL